MKCHCSPSQVTRGVCNTDPHVPGRHREHAAFLYLSGSEIPCQELRFDIGRLLHVSSATGHQTAARSINNRHIVNLPIMKLYLVDIGLSCRASQWRWSL